MPICLKKQTAAKDRTHRGIGVDHSILHAEDVAVGETVLDVRFHGGSIGGVNSCQQTGDGTRLSFFGKANNRTTPFIPLHLARLQIPGAPAQLRSIHGKGKEVTRPP